MKTYFQFTPTSVFHFLLKVLAVLVVLNIIVFFLNYYLELNGISSYSLKVYVFNLFDFYQERNLPSYFSTLNLLITAGLLYYIFKIEKKKPRPLYHRHWLYLSIIFVFLALDELLMIHEMLIKPVRYFLSNDVQMENLGVLYHAWVVPYILFAAAVGLYYFKFIFSLPTAICRNFIVAGAIFVTGAVGLEMIEGQLAEMDGGENYSSGMIYMFWVTLEETMEMFAIILFIKTLLDYIALQKDNARFVADLQVVEENTAPDAGEAALSAPPLRDQDAVEVVK